MPETVRVSFIVVALNAEDCLPCLLSDLLQQTYPSDLTEAILVDSASTDGTRAIMEDFRGRAPFPVTVLSNPRRWLASGCNLAIAAAHSDALVRLDAHARIPEDFLARSVSALSEGENIVGGSVASAEPSGDYAVLLRALDTSRFCGGAAAFRNEGKPRYVDTLAYALIRRRVFDAVGLYDERLRRTEDNELHYRMRRAGFRFFYTPSIHSVHAARDTLSGHFRQKWGNGYWIGRTMHIQPRCFAPRHLVPMFFVLAIMLGLALLPVSRVPLGLLLSCYIVLDVAFTLEAAVQARKAGMLLFFLLPFLFPSMHLTYGIGTLAGLLTPEKRHA